MHQATTMQMARDQRRLRMMIIDVRDLLNLFNWKSLDVLRLPIGIGELEGAEVVHVWMAHERHGIAITLCSPKFEPTLEGSDIPWFPYRDVDWRLVNVALVARGFVDTVSKDPRSATDPAPKSVARQQAYSFSKCWPYE